MITPLKVCKVSIILSRKSLWTQTSCTWWVEGGDKSCTVSRPEQHGVLMAVSVSDNREDVFKSPLVRRHLFAVGFTFKRATNSGVLLERAARLGFEHTIVLFQLTFFSQQCVKGCLWHFTLISLKRRVKPYSFVRRQVNTRTWRSFSFRACVEISNSKGSFHKRGCGVTSLCFEPIDKSMRL